MGVPMKQVRLIEPSKGGQKELVTWVDKVDKLKKGRRIKLDDGTWWTIAEVGDNVVDSSRLYTRYGGSYGGVK